MTTNRYTATHTDCAHENQGLMMTWVRTGRKVMSGGREVNEIARLRDSAHWECEDCGCTFLGPLDDRDYEALAASDAI